MESIAEHYQNDPTAGRWNLQNDKEYFEIKRKMEEDEEYDVEEQLRLRKRKEVEMAKERNRERQQQAMRGELMSNQLEDQVEAKFRYFFDKHDVNKDGYLDREELKALYR